MIKGELGKELIEFDGALPETFTLPDDRIPPPHWQSEYNDNRCMAYAAAGIMTVMARIFYGQELEFSIAYIFGKHRKETDRTGNGGMFTDALMPGLVNGGACLRESMPDIIDRTEAFDYVRAHPELDKEAQKYAGMFGGYINLKGQSKLQKFENIKKALVKYQLPVYGSISSQNHAVIFCGYDDKKGIIKYRNTNGFSQLFNLSYDDVKEAYLFVMADTLEKFKDISQKHWGRDAISYCLEKGYMSGTSEDTFEPDKPLSRAEICQVLKNYDERNEG